MLDGRVINQLDASMQITVNSLYVCLFIYVCCVGLALCVSVNLICIYTFNDSALYCRFNNNNNNNKKQFKWNIFAQLKLQQ